MKNSTFDERQFQGSLPLSPTISVANRRSAKQLAAAYESLARTRLSQNFILRDFLFSTEAAAMGLSNFPEHPELVIAAGQALCETLLEPILAHFGRFAITFGYQCREAIEADMPLSARRSNHRSSNPHSWDRQTFGHEVYARVDILPFCVEDGLVSKHAFGHWLMHTLNVDLLMQWRRSNVACLTISPKPRRVWVEWGNPAQGEPKQTMYMGADYWQRIYPALPEHQRPRFAPSSTGGSLQWRTDNGR